MSYDLEDIFTDTFISVIEHEQLVPYFESNMVGEGVEATVELLARRAYEKVRSQAYDPLEARPDVGRYRAGGAGVETEVDLGNLERGPPAVAEPVNASLADYLGPQPTPGEAWARFLEINRRLIKDTSLGLYDEATQAHLRQRPNTDAGQKHLANLYDGHSPMIRQQGDRAVIFFLTISITFGLRGSSIAVSMAGSWTVRFSPTLSFTTTGTSGASRASTPLHVCLRRLRLRSTWVCDAAR